MHIERGHTRSYSVENYLWKSLWTCRKLTTERWWLSYTLLDYIRVYEFLSTRCSTWAMGWKTKEYWLTFLETASFFSPKHLDWFCGLCGYSLLDARTWGWPLRVIYYRGLKYANSCLHYTIHSHVVHEENITFVKFEVLTAVLLNIQVFWDTTPRNLVTIYQSTWCSVPSTWTFNFTFTPYPLIW